MTETDRLLEMLYPVLKEKVGHMPLCKAMEIADALLAKGVLVPPVKIGQTVYAVLREFGENGEDVISDWQVCGVARFEDQWYATDKDGTEWVVGCDYCKLTRQEAEELLNGPR